jgi:site-specific DNA-methyltransferase (adenine-specific)
MMESKYAPLMSSVKQDWLTPEEVLTSVRLFDHIVLDPATGPDNPVGADHYFTVEDDGLAKSWGDGLVFVNPPYGRELPKWVRKARQEADKGCEIIMLIPARPDTKAWQEHIFPTAGSICFWAGRIRFVGAKDPAPFPSALIYWGPREQQFASYFRHLGFVVE